MILPDINLLVYAYNTGSPWHEAASQWWESSLTGRDTIGLAPAVALGFVRLLSSPKVVQRPVAPAILLSAVQDWLDTGRVKILSPGVRHFQLMRSLFGSTAAGGALCTDIHLAALALEHEAVLCTNDTDFQRFEGLSLLNPLTGG